MNIAQEPASTVLRISAKEPYTWSDGHAGTLYYIGPYEACVRGDWVGKEAELTSALIQVSRSDGGSVFDWRHLQQIKSLIVGAEWEAVELFPAESRLCDPSNARYLWCRQSWFEFGMRHGRRVLAPEQAIAPQRPFGPDEARG